MALSKEPRSAGDGRASESSSLFGRRELLTHAGLGALLLALGSGAALALRSLWPRGRRVSHHDLVAGPVASFAVGAVDDRLLREHQVLIVRTEEGFLAYSAICTHLGCTLRHAAHARQFRCMCHGSVFAADGQVLRGPAARPMERVRITLSDGLVQITPAIRYRQERGEWQQPGAFAPCPPERTPA